MVSEGGGAVQVSNRSTVILNDHIYIKFSSNNAAQYGGAMFLDATAVMVSDSNKNVINFEHNIARILGSSVYQEMSQL